MRFGMIEISAEGAFNSPQYIMITQEEGETTSASGDLTFPEDYSLGQNYPNPFNPVTNISFSLKSGGNIKLLLYDLLGNVAAEIADEYYNAGEYNIKFRADNLSSGVYIYRLITDGYTSARKMIILK
jgi:hypothetical protein